MIKLTIFSACLVLSLAVPQDYYSRPQRNWAILRLDNSIYPNGQYYYGYDTENGISAEQSGQPVAVGNYLGSSAQGRYQYTSPEGVPVQIQYVADENGYQPTGNVLPTSPPIPDAILRSIEFNELEAQRRTRYRRS